MNPIEPFSRKGGLSQSRRDVVYGKLKDDLIHYRFRPGDHLSISKLCTSLRVSNTPVREALVRLHAERLVRVEPTRGFYARHLHLEEMQELYDLTHTLLLRCLVGGTRPFVADQVLRPAALGFQSTARATRVLQAKSDDTAAFIESLLRAIARMSGSGVMIEIIGNICDRTHFVRTFEVRESTREYSLSQQFLALLDCLDRGDGNGAAAIISRCFHRQKESLPHAVGKAIASIFMHDSNER
ncbi:GntR family transcriptional regulator [Agrobacterium arsenijevicii]|uniref:GntR family transcriptional regulator n=1 Tax=Agrobacterium arsenijevicii TaxID=1585697 RepID=UPI0009E2F3E6